MKTKKGFTLIELLVVIAIIAILAAILFPVFARARDKARQTTCLSNSKQIAMGILMYSDDYDEIFPAAGARIDVTVPTPATDNSYWGGGNDQNSTGFTSVANGDFCMATNFEILITPYIKTSKIFHCPNDPNWATASSYWGAAKGSATGTCSALGGNNWYAWRPVSATTDPAGTILTFCGPANMAFANNDTTTWPNGATWGWSAWAGDYDFYAGLADETPYGAPAIPGNRLDPNNILNMCFPRFGDGPCQGALLCTVWEDTTYGPSPFKQVHNGGTNYSFADGHAKWYRVEATVGKTDPVTGKIVQHNMWTIDPND